MRIAVIGSGHVGLVVGTGLAEIGHFVTCMDRDAERIDQARAGHMPFYEPGLEELVVRNIEEERLTFTTDLAEAVNNALVVLLCVGTPALENGDLDTSQLMAAVDDIGRVMSGYRIIANKSTCPIGTAEAIAARLQELTEHDFDVVVNPEFLKEGDAVDDFMRPDRVILGCEDVRVQEIMKEMYGPLLRTGNPLICMSLRSAEMTKLAANAMLATRIAFINELADMCEVMGSDIADIREGLATDRRIGAAYLHAGLGFGGSCLPKDVVALGQMAARAGAPSGIVEAVASANDAHQRRFIQRILDYYGDAISEKRLAMWGGTFKARTGDVRGAVALRIIDTLREAGAKLVVYDPVAGPALRARYGDDVEVVSKNYDALHNADGLIIATEWREFYRPDFQRVAELMREKVIFDGRNLYTASALSEHGFRYFSVGRVDV